MPPTRCKRELRTHSHTVCTDKCNHMCSQKHRGRRQWNKFADFSVNPSDTQMRQVPIYDVGRRCSASIEPDDRNRHIWSGEALNKGAWELGAKTCPNKPCRPHLTIAQTRVACTPKFATTREHPGLEQLDYECTADQNSKFLSKKAHLDPTSQPSTYDHTWCQKTKWTVFLLPGDLNRV
jgi:hypothetical protein